ncbi:hypothetical protein PRUPE_2G176100 [Prunus persica]|uniref:Uncharacterized protein n=2 Tax=Prunus persica TaxID=3760 RepID=M5XCA7_PRUPE|nr:uncharacterized protein LOC18786838 isoform X2 [Prunus persica]ONI23222.1 hypothetical protein PRUPE_2G176100 [Prunus persica]
MEAGGGDMEDLTGPLRWNDERSLYICSMVLKVETVSYVINSIRLSDLFSSSCSCRFDPDLPTNPNPTAIGDPDLPTNPTAIGGDGDRTKCLWCSKCPWCSKSLKAPDEEKEDCSELNHPDNTTTRTECAACSKGNSELRYRASLTGEYLPFYMGCGVFGSQIVFGGGAKSRLSTVAERSDRRFGPDASRAIYGFETRDPNPTIKLRGRERMFGKLLGEVPKPLLMEVSGKLYALSGETILCKKKPPYFQVFNPNSKKWSPLPAPSILEPGGSYGDFSCAIVDSFILLSTRTSMVYGFDTSEEEHPKWIEVGTPSFFSDRPLPFKGKALLLMDDNESFMFSYKKRKQRGYAIVVYSVAPDHVSVIKKLPLEQVLAEADKLPADFRRTYSTYDHCFVHIEGLKVCLIMSLYISPGNSAPRRSEKLRIMSLTFEISPPTTKGRDVKHIHTRFFDCDTRLSHTSHPCENTRHANVLGAFVL